MLRFVHVVFFALLFFITLFPIDSAAQRFYSVVFDKLPEDMQLYARDGQNEAVVPVSGVIEVPGFTHMSTVVLRENVRVGYEKSVLQYNGNTKTSFSMSPKIKAELAEYSFVVYACSATDSVEMVRRDKVLAGDFYLINGQSNANRSIRYDKILTEEVKKFSRTIGRTPDQDPGFTRADTTWMNADWVTPTMGYWGRDLQRQIIETYKIPVCVINGAVPGSGIESHIVRNTLYPADASTIYGSLLLRTLKSKATRIRAFFWFQGEHDVWNEPAPYPERFDILMNFWQQDYPMVDRFVVFQINILTGMNYEAGALREFQRKTKYLYPRTDHFAVMGLGHMEDDTHFDGEGYTKLTTQLLDFVGPKEYQSARTDNIESPDIQKVFYDKGQNAINLVFNQNQTLKWGADTVIAGVTTRLQDQFFLDGDESRPAPIASWQVAGNRVTLRFTSPLTASRLNYMLAFRNRRYEGPFLRNIRGLGAFSFHEFPIAPPLDDPALTASISSVNVVKVSWTKVNSALSYLLERKEVGAPEYSTVKVFADNSITTFEDTGITYDKTYVYRLTAIGTRSESQSETTIQSPPLLGVEPGSPGVSVYPNPARDLLNIKFADPVTGALALMTTSGSVVASVDMTASKEARLHLSHLPAGTYVLTFRLKNGTVSVYKFFKF